MVVELTNKKDNETYIIEVANYIEAKEWLVMDTGVNNV